MKEQIFDVAGFQTYIALRIKEYQAFMMEELAKENSEFIKMVKEDKEIMDESLPKEKQQEKVKQFFEKFTLSNNQGHWDKVEELFTIDKEKLKTFIIE